MLGVTYFHTTVVVHVIQSVQVNDRIEGYF